MVTNPVKSELFFELVYNLLDYTEEDTILEKVIPKYLRKLNCFVACVLKQTDDGIEDKFILPYIFRKNPEWSHIRSQIIGMVRKNLGDCPELFTKTDYYYGFCMDNYGILILGRKKPFDKMLKNELLPIVAFLRKSLLQSIEVDLRRKTESRLRQERNLLRTIINNIPINVYAKDPEGNKILANKAEQQFLNLEEASLLRKTDDKLYDEAFATRARQEDEQVLRDGTSILNRETSIIDGQGNERIALVSKLPLQNELGEISGLVGITFDITDRKQIEDQLLFKQRLLQGIALGTEELLVNDERQNAIQSALSVLGKSVDVDRTYLFQNEIGSDGKMYTSQLFEWNKGNAAPQIDNPDLQMVPIETFGSFLDKLFDKKPFEAIISQMDPEDELRHILEAQDILSVLIIPIFHQGSFWGFIGYDDCTTERKWSEDELLLLRSFASNISIAVGKFEQEKELKEMALFHLENPNPVVRIDRDGQILLQNKLARNIDYIFINGERLSVCDFLKQVATKVSEANRQTVLEIKSGGQFYLAHVKLSESAQHINIYFNNITKQKEAEIVIVESNAQLSLLRNLINSSSDAVQVSHESGQLFYINQVASERLGIPMHQVQQYWVQDFEKIFEEPGSWEAHVKELKETDFIAVEGENLNLTYGEVIPVEVTVKYINIGGQGYVMAISRDISQRKQAERQMQLQEEKFRNIISNMNLGLLEVDKNEIIQFCNHSFELISGFTLEELRGRSASDLFIARRHRELLQEKNQLREQGMSDSYEVLVKNKRGEPRWWLISGAPNYNDTGEIIGSIGVHLDITQQKKLEADLEKAVQQAREASKAKEIFLANMSHEIRTPLNGIIGMIRQLKKEKLTPHQANYIDSTNKAAQHLLSVVNNILDITKIEAGELKLEQRNFSLRKLVDDVSTILRLQLEGKDIRFKVLIDQAIAEYFLGDEARLRQILINLVGNAIKFTEKGRISIRCLAEGFSAGRQKVVLIIKDTGIGMDEAYKSKLFEKFQQEDASISRKFGGTGLGMFITKELVDLMGGEIEVESEKDLGTEIKISLTLPIGKKELQEKELEAKDVDLADAKILLVEDNAMNRLVASNTLSMLKAEIVEAEHGKQAIELLEEQEFDLVLMDLQMPIMDGMEATKYIRNELQLDIPIIALSANAFKAEIDACKAIGMNEYVTKPFEEKDLIQVIAKFSNIIIEKKSHLDDDAAPPREALYDLTKLKSMSLGDEQFVRQMMQLFVDIVPESIQVIQEAHQNNDLPTLNKTAHKLKPSIDHMHITSLHDDIRKLEKFSLEKGTEDDLKHLVEKVVDILQEVVQELEKELVA